MQYMHELVEFFKPHRIAVIGALTNSKKRGILSDKKHCWLARLSSEKVRAKWFRTYDL